jgi:hypothetical protein
MTFAFDLHRKRKCLKTKILNKHLLPVVIRVIQRRIQTRAATFCLRVIQTFACHLANANLRLKPLVQFHLK